MRTSKQFPERHSHEAIALVVRPVAREQQPVPGGPQLSQASGAFLREIQIVDEYGDHHSISVPVERPLAVLLDGSNVATLWTLGAHAEWLVLGYLWNQQWLADVTALESISVDWVAGTATVTTRKGSASTESSPGRRPDINFGPMGTQASGLLVLSETAGGPALPARRIARSTLLSLLENVAQDDSMYRAAGSVHGCALFQGADLWVSVEDVSRRNSIDTISGWMALHGISGADKILYTTGRLTAEIVMKALQNGIPIVVSRKGITALCYDLAERVGMTLFGHATKGRYICYAGVERFDSEI